MSRLEPRAATDAGEWSAPGQLFTSGHSTGMPLNGVPQLRPCPSCGRSMMKISTSEVY